MKKFNKVFISHQNISEEELDKFVKQLEDNECEVSVSEHEKDDDNEETDEENKLTEEIESCDIVFVLVGEVTEENECVKKEIEEADRQDKPIIGIYIGGGMSSVPPGIESFGSGLIINDITRIISVLEGNPCPWETPNGTPRKQTKKIDKPDC